jgi:hypothetical protein
MSACVTSFDHPAHHRAEPTLSRDACSSRPLAVAEDVDPSPRLSYAQGEEALDAAGDRSAGAAASSAMACGEIFPNSDRDREWLYAVGVDHCLKDEAFGISWRLEEGSKVADRVG